MRPLDKIIIQDLELYCRHGVFPEENALGQKFLFSAILYVTTRQAGKKDDLELSVNYGEICHFIRQYMEEHTYKLLEAALEHLAEAILLRWPQIGKLTLKVKKPWAPVGLPLDTVAVEITRGWHDAYIALGSNMGPFLSRRSSWRFSMKLRPARTGCVFCAGGRGHWISISSCMTTWCWTRRSCIFRIST